MPCRALIAAAPALGSAVRGRAPQRRSSAPLPPHGHSPDCSLTLASDSLAQPAGARPCCQQQGLKNGVSTHLQGPNRPFDWARHFDGPINLCVGEPCTCSQTLVSCSLRYRWTVKGSSRSIEWGCSSVQGYSPVRKGSRALCTLHHSLCQGHQIPAGLQSYDRLLHAAQTCIKSCIWPVRLPTLCTQTWSILKGLCSHLARRPGGPGKLLLCSCSTLFPAWLSAFPRLCHCLCFAFNSLPTGSQSQPTLMLVLCILVQEQAVQRAPRFYVEPAVLRTAAAGSVFQLDALETHHALR